MTPAELRKELAAGTIRPAYLVAGSEALLRDEAVAALRDAVVDEASRDFNHDRMDGASTAPGALLDAVRTLPVMAPRRLVELREPEAKRGGALADAVAEAVGLLSEPPEVVLLVVASRIDKRSRFVKAFGKGGLVVCDPPKGVREVAAAARHEADRLGTKLGPGAAELLAESVGRELLALRREIEKAALLAGPGETISRDHVSRCVSSIAEQPIWDLTDAIGEGRTPDALGVLHHLLEGGAPHPVLLGSLASHFRKLVRTRAGEPPRGHPFAVRKLESQARRYTPARLRACLSAIHEVDQVLKGQGGLPPDLALERLVLGLAA